MQRVPDDHPPSWRIIRESDLTRLIVAHAAQRQLCAELERCADALPDPVGHETAVLICQEIVCAMQLSAPLPDGSLGPLFACEHDAPILASVLARIHDRHVADIVHAGDLLAALTAEPGPSAIGIDALGYMMRCLFDGRRRAIDMEELAFQLCPGRLTPEAHEALCVSFDSGATRS